MTEARRRIPILLLVPARVHWLSVAPLLEPLDLRPWLGRGVDWIVVGGETGAKNARYTDGSRISRALIGSWVTTIGMLNLATASQVGGPPYLRRRAGIAGEASAFAGLSSRALI